MFSIGNKMVVRTYEFYTGVIDYMIVIYRMILKVLLYKYNMFESKYLVTYLPSCGSWNNRERSNIYICLSCDEQVNTDLKMLSVKCMIRTKM